MLKKLTGIFVFLLIFFSFTVYAGAEAGAYIIRINSSEEKPVFSVVDTLEEAENAVRQGQALYYEKNSVISLPDSLNCPIEAKKRSATLLSLNSSPRSSYDMSAFAKLGADGSGVTVAVIDSGVNYSLDEFEGRIIGGKNMLDPDSDYTDSNGHGTTVCSVITGKTVGAATGAQIYMYKCFGDSDTSSLSVIADAITEAADNSECKIINMSFAAADSKTIADAVSYACSKNKILVAAAGNYGGSDYLYPASFPNVLSVGSVSSAGVHSYFSQKNDAVDITVCGEGINVVTADGSVASKKGTSFSTPAVSAVIACMLELNPSISFADVYSYLTQTASDAGDEGKDNLYGYGILNIPSVASLMDNFKIICGDADRDGNITSLDLVILSRHIANWNGYKDFSQKTIDINGDGTVTAADAVILARYISGWKGYSHLPYSTEE